MIKSIHNINQYILVNHINAGFYIGNHGQPGIGIK